jgi:hypothetical protein
VHQIGLMLNRNIYPVAQLVEQLLVGHMTNHEVDGSIPAVHKYFLWAPCENFTKSSSN